MSLNREKDLQIEPIWMENRIPAYGARLKSALCAMSHLTSVIDPETEYGRALLPIAQWAGCSKQMKMAFGLFRWLLRKMLGALTEERYKQVIRETHNTYWTSRPVTDLGLTADRSVVISEECLRTMGELLQGQCALCDCTPEEKRNCKYRKIVKELAFLDEDEHFEENFGQCMGQQMRWRE